MSDDAILAEMMARSPRLRQWAADELAKGSATPAQAPPQTVAAPAPAAAPATDDALPPVLSGLLDDLRDMGSRADRLAGAARLRDAGYSDEGIKLIEELMQQRGIADHEAGMRLFERENPPAEPVAGGGSRHMLFAPARPASIDMQPLLAGDDDRFLDGAIATALREARGG